MVDLGDVRVGDHDEGEVPQSLDPSRQSSRKKGEGEVGRCKKGILGQRGPAVSGKAWRSVFRLNQVEISHPFVK